MALKIGNIDWNVGRSNPSGIVPIAYRIAKSEITSWPTIDDLADAATVDAYVNYTGDFVLKAGSVFETMYSTPGKGKVTFEPIGEIDNTMYTNKAVLSFPALIKEARAYAKAAANGDFIYIIPTMEGDYVVIGHPSPAYRVKSPVSGDTGDAAGSAKGVTINLECNDETPLPCYVGDLVTAAGTLDTSTGIFTPVAP